ncbi:MAG: Holliday junction resolvase RuvX [Candidatus Blackburnbacteria bacterium]|nr:Holliday junction resolvase RuvX [Candidatus Blackburnbacteria bacterium]
MILGIDHGKAKLGLARADGPLAQPYMVVRVKSAEDALEKVAKMVKVEQVAKVVVGVSEGEIGKEQEEFANNLRQTLGVPIETWDETLSTQDAQAYTINMGMGRKKRREREDAYAAAIMLQSFLDNVQK